MGYTEREREEEDRKVRGLRESAHEGRNLICRNISACQSLDDRQCNGVGYLDWAACRWRGGEKFGGPRDVPLHVWLWQHRLGGCSTLLFGQERRS